MSEVKLNFILIIVLVLSTLISGCLQNNSKAISPSVLDCQKRDGDYQIITNPDGSQTGRCMLLDGTICTDEQYYKTEEGCYTDQVTKKRY